MDLHKALRDLYEEKTRLNRVIARLEQRLQSPPGPVRPGRRGRKNMGAEERLKVSTRMKAYWAERRARMDAKKKGGPQQPENETPLGNGISV